MVRAEDLWDGSGAGQMQWNGYDEVGWNKLNEIERSDIDALAWDKDRVRLHQGTPAATLQHYIDLYRAGEGNFKPI